MARVQSIAGAVDRIEDRCDRLLEFPGRIQGAEAGLVQADPPTLAAAEHLTGLDLLVCLKLL